MTAHKIILNTEVLPELHLTEQPVRILNTEAPQNPEQTSI